MKRRGFFLEDFSHFHSVHTHTQNGSRQQTQLVLQPVHPARIPSTPVLNLKTAQNSKQESNYKRHSALN